MEGESREDLKAAHCRIDAFTWDEWPAGRSTVPAVDNRKILLCLLGVQIGLLRISCAMRLA